jgi:hypothetical protein
MKLKLILLEAEMEHIEASLESALASIKTQEVTNFTKKLMA